jgi:hypothetical protein
LPSAHYGSIGAVDASELGMICRVLYAILSVAIKHGVLSCADSKSLFENHQPTAVTAVFQIGT